jgi:hypothetical protein
MDSLQTPLSFVHLFLTFLTLALKDLQNIVSKVLAIVLLSTGTNAFNCLSIIFHNCTKRKCFQINFFSDLPIQIVTNTAIPGINIIKLFSSSLTVERSKLVRFLLDIFRV